jgi:adenylate cyclase
MFTDMVGSTALAQANEAEALGLRDEQEELVRPLFEAHHGREIKSMGDGFLAEFDSALRAVQCAIDIQRLILDRNSRTSRSPIQLRIGIHLGDVEARNRDIFGDSVNVASRIEPLADPGGICISEPVFGQVRNKIPNEFQKLEPTILKGVQFPFDLYRILLSGTLASKAEEPAGVTRLAVLPFANISPDPNDAYFADGLTEELITVLSQIPELLVIARTSVMPYKSTTKGISQIGSELGVGTVLEGSVRKAANQLRITVQLIDVSTQGHSWAKNYDRQLDDVFRVQTEIANEVAHALRIRVGEGITDRLGVRTRVLPESYLAYGKDRTLIHDDTEASFRAAKELFQKAIAIDDRNPAAHAALADVTRLLGWYGYERGRPRSERDLAGRASAARAIEIDPELADAHNSLGLILWEDFQWDAAEAEFRIALASNASSAAVHFHLANLLRDRARPEEALQEYEVGEQSDPLSLTGLLPHVEVLCWLGRFDDAKVKLDRMRELDPLALRYHWGFLMYFYCRADPDGVRREADWIVEHFQKERWHMEAIWCATTGRLDQAREWISQCKGGEGEPDPPFDIAFHYASIGDLDECFRWLTTALDRFFLPIGLFRLAPFFANVRSDPRFTELLKRQNLA